MNLKVNFLLILICSLICILYLYAAETTKVPTNEMTNSITLSFEKNGLIEGSACYPADGIPSDMKIYAENIESGKIYEVQISKLNDARILIDNTKYRMRIPQGTYHVYAMTKHNPLKSNYRAYYSEFVTCGLRATCKSHKPIEVKIEAGKTLHNINPCDWYKRDNNVPK